MGGMKSGKVRPGAGLAPNFVSQRERVGPGAGCQSGQAPAGRPSSDAWGPVASVSMVAVCGVWIVAPRSDG